MGGHVRVVGHHLINLLAVTSRQSVPSQWSIRAQFDGQAPHLDSMLCLSFSLLELLLSPFK